MTARKQNPTPRVQLYTSRTTAFCLRFRRVSRVNDHATRIRNTKKKLANIQRMYEEKRGKRRRDKDAKDKTENATGS